MKWLNIVLIVTLVLLWSFDAIAIKYLTMNYPVSLILIFKFASCVLLLLPSYKATNVPLTSIVWLSTLYTVIHAGGWILSVRLGLYLSVASFIEVMATPVTIMLGFIFLHEKISLKMVFGVATAFIGASAVIFWSESAVVRAPLYGLLAASVSTLAWSVYNIYLGKLEKRYAANHYPLLVRMFFVGLLQSLVMFMIFDSHDFDFSAHKLDMYDGIAAVMTVLGTLAVNMILMFLIKHHNVGKISVIFLLAPFINSILAYMIFGEPLGVGLVIGGILTCAGVFMINMQQNSH